MEASNIKNIAKALCDAQKEMNTAKKNADNPFTKKMYADLNSIREAVMPSLNKNGVLLLQPIIQGSDGFDYVQTILIHSESGESVSCNTRILVVQAGNPQSHGSGITYARRYGLQSLLCVGAEDDDGNKASEGDDAGGVNPSQPAKKQPKKIDVPQVDENGDPFDPVERASWLMESKTYDEFVVKYKTLPDYIKKDRNVIQTFATLKERFGIK